MAKGGKGKKSAGKPPKSGKFDSSEHPRYKGRFVDKPDEPKKKSPAEKKATHTKKTVASTPKKTVPAKKSAPPKKAAKKTTAKPPAAKQATLSGGPSGKKPPVSKTVNKSSHGLESQKTSGVDHSRLAKRVEGFEKIDPATREKFFDHVAKTNETMFGKHVPTALVGSRGTSGKHAYHDTDPTKDGVIKIGRDNFDHAHFEKLKVTDKYFQEKHNGKSWSAMSNAKTPLDGASREYTHEAGHHLASVHNKMQNDPAQYWGMPPKKFREAYERAGESGWKLDSAYGTRTGHRANEETFAESVTYRFHAPEKLHPAVIDAIDSIIKDVRGN